MRFVFKFVQNTDMDGFSIFHPDHSEWDWDDVQIGFFSNSRYILCNVSRISTRVSSKAQTKIVSSIFIKNICPVTQKLQNQDLRIKALMIKVSQNLPRLIDL